MPTPEPPPESETPITPSVISSRKAKAMFVLGLTVYCVVVWALGWRDIRDQILEANIGLIILSAALVFFATWMRVWKWRYALGKGQHATGLFFISKATGNFTPGRLGEFAPMVIRSHRTPKVGAWILFDRIIEVFVTLALGLYGLAMIHLLLPWQFALMLLAVVAGSVVGVYLLTHRKMFMALADRFKPEGFLNKTAMLLAAMSTELGQFLKTLPLVFSITVVTKVMDLFAIVLMFRALATFPTFALVAASKCALAIVSFLPLTPPATGAPHFIQAWMMNYSAGIEYEALLVGISIEIAVVSLTFWTSFGLAGRFIKDATVGGK